MHPLCTCMALIGAITLLFISTEQTAHAEFDAETLYREVEPLLLAPPSSSSVLPLTRNGKRPSALPPAILIGSFEVDSSDQLDWGQAVGEMLRIILKYRPGTQLRTLSDDFSTHAYEAGREPGMSPYDIGRSPRSVQLAAMRNGIDYAVVGRIEKSAEKLVVSATFLETKTLNHLDHHSWSAHPSEFPKVLLELTEWIDQDIRKFLDADFLPKWDRERVPTEMATFDIYASALSDLLKLQYDSAYRTFVTLVAEHPEFAPFTISFLRSAGNHLDDFGYQDLRRQIAQKFPNHFGIRLAAIESISWHRKPLQHHKVSLLRELLQEEALDPGAMHFFNTMLRKTGRLESSLVVIRDICRTWPKGFHCPLSFALTIDEYAWLLQGDGTAEHLSKSTREVVTKLRSTANRAIDEAIAINPNMTYYGTKIHIMGRFDEEMMDTFWQAVETDPFCECAYRHAMRFSGPEWGGRREVQRRIYQLMKKNNPQANWVAGLGNRHLGSQEITRMEKQAIGFTVALGHSLQVDSFTPDATAPVVAGEIYEVHASGRYDFEPVPGFEQEGGEISLYAVTQMDNPKVELLAVQQVPSKDGNWLLKGSYSVPKAQAVGFELGFKARAESYSVGFYQRVAPIVGKQAVKGGVQP